MSNEKRLWIIEARDGAWGANGICKGELVRCKDCQWYDKDPDMYDAYCDKNGIAIEDDFYCADGERKEQDDATN